MRILDKRTSCVWCGRRLVHESYEPCRNVNFGPVPRSREHIIPESLFGRIVTYDLCKLCNGMFGGICDFALLDDGRIVEAAQKAGFEFKDIKPSYTVTRETPTGKKVKTSFKEGVLHQCRQKFDDGTFIIPFTDGKISDRDFEAAVQMLTKKVLAKGRPGLADRNVVALLARQFWERIRKAPNRLHTDLTLGESFGLTQLPSRGIVQGETNPWETDWCLAKSVFEFSSLLWPREYLQYCGPVLAEIRDFLANRHHDPVAGTGTGIFAFTDLQSMPVKQHEATCLLRPDYLSWELTYFGTASWKYERHFGPGPSGKVPPMSYEIRIKNPFGADAPDATWNIRELSSS